MEADLTLSIVIITKDTRELLEGLLDSIKKDAPLASLGREIIVIDNASTDGTEEFVRDACPHARYIRNDRNAGFAVAVNQGAKTSAGRYVLLLNSDTRLIEGEVAKMVAAAESIPDLGLMGPQLVYEDLSLQRSVAAVPGLAGEMLPGSGRIPRGTSAGNAEPARDVESLIGAAIMIRKNAFDDLHGFDERFFFFLEETDFCLRARRKGYRVVFFPGAKVIHLQGRTVRKNWVKGRMEYNISLRKFMKKHHGRLYLTAFDAVRLAKSLVFVIAVPLSLFGSRMRLRYSYYLRLVVWYMHGCPDDAGLRG
ncbi:MAG: N-acetylglucosaminyl-diphospho-decaprenol L-rhamnosyltransferase [Syntrophorhabdus sp. PtaB.Bin184]|jgi:N-acetylglucosaminyl-diphospho-decaprenol L-rhamnosyltransferase|nr:MAG: N-acetylglucosaminyl-diphospho-decaprenol L-rhamnosyltransferase [Syntrophorhabdus sp. PtaB.Bin184]